MMDDFDYRAGLYQAMIKSITLPKLPEEKVYFPEPVFRKTWMPMFLHYFAGHQDGVVTYWAHNVAGNYYQEVHVVSDMDNPEETVQFVVPPLVSRDNEVFTEGGDIPFDVILKHVELNNQVFPGSGDNLLHEHVGKRIKRESPKSIRNEEMWRKIYMYYEIDAPFLHTPEARAQAAKEGISLPTAVVDTNEVEGFDDDDF